MAVTLLHVCPALGPQALLAPGRIPTLQWQPSSYAQTLPLPPVQEADLYSQAMNKMREAGISLILGVTYGGYTFQDNKVTDDSGRDDKSDTKLSDGSRIFPVLRLSFRENFITTAKWNNDAICRVGWRIVTTAGWYNAGREFEVDKNGDGIEDRSRMRVQGQYLYVAPELVARFLAPQPGDAWSLAVAIGAGLGYSHLRGRVKNRHNPDGPPESLDVQGLGPAIPLHVEASLGNFVIIGQYENVDMLRGDRLYVSAFFSAGVGYLARF